MRLLGRSLPLLLLAACGSGPEPVAPTITATPAPIATAVATAAPAMPLAAIDPSLPAGAAGVAAIDAAQADAILGALLRGLDPALRERLERLLHLAGGALADGQAARVLGLDPARPIVASMGLAGAGGPVRERLAALVGQKVTTAELRRAFEGTPATGVAVRVVFPATDAPAVMNALAALFEADQWTAAPPPEGVDEMYVARRHRAFGGVTRGAGVVVADVLIPAGIDRDEKAALAQGSALLQAVRSRPPGSPAEAPPALEGHPARVRYSPAAFADLGLVIGVATTLRALATPGIADEQRDALAAQGFAEAAGALRLSGTAAGAHFDRLDATLDGGYGSLGFTIRADLGKATTFAPEAWASGPAIHVPGAYASLDLSLPWLRTWEAVGVPFGQRRAVHDAVREAGWPAFFVAAPQSFAAEIWQPMERLAAHRALLPHLERVAIFSPARDLPDGWVALLHPGTKPADLRCILADSAACPPASQLRPGATVAVSGQHFRLVQVKARWALVVSRDKAVAEKTKLDLVTAPAGRVLLPGGTQWAKEFRGVPVSFFADGYTGEIALEGRSAVARFRPTAQAPAKKP